MSETRLQDEYNEAVAQSDIFISLFGTKVGKYTEEEFDVAYHNFKENNRPKFIYTFFKDLPLTTSTVNLQNLQSLINFQQKVSGLGHFYTMYKSTEDLILQLKKQLDKILQQTS